MKKQSNSVPFLAPKKNFISFKLWGQGGTELVAHLSTVEIVLQESSEVLETHL